MMIYNYSSWLDERVQNLSIIDHRVDITPLYLPYNFGGLLMEREEFYKYKRWDLEVRAAAHLYIVDRLEGSIDPRSIEIISVNNDGNGMAVIYWKCNETDNNDIEKSLLPVDMLCSYTRMNKL